MQPIKANYKQWRRAMLAAVHNSRTNGTYPQRRGTVTRMQLAFGIKQRRTYFAEQRK